jgi:hypothetical protein
LRKEPGKVKKQTLIKKSLPSEDQESLNIRTSDEDQEEDPETAPRLPPVILHHYRNQSLSGTPIERANQLLNIFKPILTPTASKQEKTIENPSAPSTIQSNFFQNSFLWLIGWHRFQFEAQLVLRCSRPVLK